MNLDDALASLLHKPWRAARNAYFIRKNHETHYREGLAWEDLTMQVDEDDEDGDANGPHMQ